MVKYSVKYSVRYSIPPFEGEFTVSLRDLVDCIAAALRAQSISLAFEILGSYLIAIFLPFLVKYEILAGAKRLNNPKRRDALTRYYRYLPP